MKYIKVLTEQADMHDRWAPTLVTCASQKSNSIQIRKQFRKMNSHSNHSKCQSKPYIPLRNVPIAIYNHLLIHFPYIFISFGVPALWSLPHYAMVCHTGLPSSVRNCTFSNQTHHSVEIQCVPGYDGGLPQFFVLELISTRTGRVR